MPYKKLPARPGHFLSQTAYLRLMDAAIAQFQARTTNLALRGQMGAIYATIAQLNRPFTYLDILNLLDPNETQSAKWRAFHIHGRIQYLATHGFIRRLGRTFSNDWAYAHNRSTTLYELIPDADPRFVQCARRDLYTTIDHLNCTLAASTHYSRHAHPHDARTAQILTMRQAGLTLEAIGAHLHLTRERIRQILGHAYFPSTQKRA